MTMPEAPMHQDRLAAGGEDQIGLAGDLRDVEAEPIAHAVDEGADAAFGGAPLALDAGHAFTAFGGGESVHPSAPRILQPILAARFRRS